MKLNHVLEKEELDNLYRKLEDFIADLTFEEYLVHKQAFQEVQSLIHERLQESNNQTTQNTKSQ